ncbi:RusA family crossover junction endodeoxyribonuclease [Eubacteriales bacterium KG125]
MIFEIAGKPQGKARARTFYNPRLGRSQTVTPRNTVLYENFIKECCLTSSSKEKWFNKEPLEMCITTYFEIPKSTTKKNRALMESGELFPTKKPDADNIAKVICDALNGIAYKDDTQIVALKILKKYTTDMPKVVVEIKEFENA